MRQQDFVRLIGQSIVAHRLRSVSRTQTPELRGD